MILGIITTLLLALTVIKFVAKRTKFHKVDQFLMKTHKVTGILLIIVALIHLITSFSLFETRPLIIYILGILALASMMIVVASYCFRKKIGPKWIVIHRIGTVVILMLITVHIGMGIKSLTDYKAAINEIAFEDVDVSNISDGIYEGEYDVGYIYARVEVTVTSGEISKIALLEHQNERGTPAEIITDKIVEEQKIDVDAISGATNSSKVIKKAVENAVMKGSEGVEK